ncbi:MAG: DUF3696 domain-containing protein [Pseudomonadales bacterium]|nr:DUF3696 domain-containing protein [Pseudomonadales bacterium]
MFTMLQLKNFKAWRDSAEVQLAPVTMLLGANSTGKSSLLQSLLLLKQTVNSPDRSIHLNLGGDEVNDYFNFGDFDDVLTQGASPREFGIGLGIKRIRPPQLTDIESARFIEQAKLITNYQKTRTGAPVIKELLLASGDNSYQLARKAKESYAVFWGQELWGDSPLYAPERSIAFSADAIQLLASHGGKAEDISLAIRRELESISYLGPLRRKPERDYVWNKSKPGELGIDGGGVINAILSSALTKNKENDADNIIDGVSKWLARMGVAERLDVRQLGRSTRYELVVIKDGIEANLRDVGIGISQVLPVLTLAYFAPQGSTILLEEPEIHLHPLAQSVLAELFVEVSKERQVQFIVETHSEHIFRRMQTLMAKKAVTSEDCQMYFVEREGADAKLCKLDVDGYGRVKNWPHKFFGDALGETKEQARLMFERQKQERQG